MELLEALKSMDHEDETQWTSDGAPRLDFLSELVGEKITRQDVVNIAPHFSKSHADLPEEDEVANESPMEDAVDAKGEEVPEGEDEEVAEARAAWEAAVAEERRCKANLKHAQEEHAEAVAVMDRAHDKLVKADPPMSNGEAIRNYINKSNESRLRRAMAAQAVIANLPKDAIDPRAPIDQAFARRNKRGTQRPQR